MNPLAIRVENLTKTYPIRHAARHLRVTSAVADGVRNLFRRDEVETFRALDGVTLEVRKGEVVGIIGRNGAGKSTLLKVLSRITEPTSGRVELFGRVGSLLEVGTGFHPELTGRENIYLNGAILGMRRREIEAQFDAIVDFAEVERFLDTPVKRYSSGMYVRLAFAVAAHLNPEILIVDEVLAVGDTQFQKKCLGKMQDVSRSDGRTVIFVSHNMSAINELCGTAILLQNGRLIKQGGCDEVVRTYLHTMAQAGTGRVDIPNPAPDKVVAFTSAQSETEEGVRGYSFDVRHPIRFTFEYEVRTQISGFELAARIEREDGLPIFSTILSDASDQAARPSGPGTYTSSFTVPGMFLMPDDYVVTFVAHMPVGEVFDRHDQAFGFTVEDTGTPYGAYGNLRTIGTVILTTPWTTTAHPSEAATAATDARGS